MSALTGDSGNPGIPAVSATHSANGRGVAASSAQGIAIEATANTDTAVFAHSDSGLGIDARSASNTAVVAQSAQGIAIEASATRDTAVFAHSDSGLGIDARSASNRAVFAQSAQGIAIEASATRDTAVFAHSDTGMGIDARSAHGIAIQAIGAVVIQGDMTVSNNITVSGDVLLTGADCAEQFDVNGPTSLEPGTVVAIDENGALRESLEPYNKKVAGVVSGGGSYRPALLLDGRPSAEGRVAVALAGKVFCKVDATSSPVEFGDLLTTAARPGHAMKATDPAKAFGAVIGKALRSLPNGIGLIPILVGLQ